MSTTVADWIDYSIDGKEGWLRELNDEFNSLKRYKRDRRSVQLHRVPGQADNRAVNQAITGGRESLEIMRTMHSGLGGHLLKRAKFIDLDCTYEDDELLSVVLDGDRLRIYKSYAAWTGMSEYYFALALARADYAAIGPGLKNEYDLRWAELSLEPVYDLAKTASEDFARRFHAFLCHHASDKLEQWSTDRGRRAAMRLNGIAMTRVLEL